MFAESTIDLKIFDSRDEWLKGRTTIGGSDASTILGLNPYKTNQTLWDEKVNGVLPRDLSDVPYVVYGTNAETYLRSLFELDYPQYDVFYEENNMWTNTKYPWGHYSADGWLRDKDGRRGILEIKTTNILKSSQKENWRDKIPENYYVQCLHGLMILEADFVVLKAQLKTEFDGEVYLQTKHYHIERKDVQTDIDYLIEKEREFYQSMLEGKKPSLILPML